MTLEQTTLQQVSENVEYYHKLQEDKKRIEMSLEIAKKSIMEALSFIDGIEDSGGTNINDALIRALKLITPGERPNYVLFLTDGLPTVGRTDVADILKNISSAN